MNKRPLFISLVLFVIITLNMGLSIRIASADAVFRYVDDDYDSSTPGWGVDHFSHIQDAVDAANDGDTIYVYTGTYHESVEVTETDNLAFIAEKGGKPVKSVVIDADGDHGFEIRESSGVKISGFKIVDAFNGIGTYKADFCDFTKNDIRDCSSYGIYVTGSYCTATWNFLMNTSGIYCSPSDVREMIKIVLSKNTILDSNGYGIALWDGINCSITYNLISNAAVGINLAYLEGCSRNMIMHNEISNVTGGIKFEEPVYPGTPPMTDNTIGHNYVHDITPFPGYLGYGIDIKYKGGGVAETTHILHNTIKNSDIGIRNHGNSGIVHHNDAINCATDYIDLGTANIDFKNSWNP